MDTLSGETILSNLFCLPSKKESTLRGRVNSNRKEFTPCGSKFFPFRVDHFFRRGLIFKRANRKAQKLSSLKNKMTETVPSTSIPVKLN